MKRPNPSLILAVICFGVFVAADDLTVVSTMLRQIVFDLQIPLPDGLDKAAWIINAYLIAYVVVMPVTGRISDLVGRRAVYVAALLLFLLGSIWLPFAKTLPAFLAGRVLTAIGGGAMVPVGMAIIGDIFPTAKRPSALGILGAVDTAGWVWGPLYGAMLIRFLSWKWQFYLNVPLALLGLIATWYVLRDLPAPVGRTRFDWLGTLTLTLSLLALNLALLNGSQIQNVANLSQLNDTGRDSPFLLYLLALASLIAFIFFQRSRPDVALIDLKLFQRANFVPAGLVNFLVGAVLIIAMVNVPLFINIVVIDTVQAALDSGKLLSAMTISMAVMAYVGGKLTERWGYRPVTMAGLLGISLAFWLMGQHWAANTPYRQMSWQLALLGVGFGLLTAPISAAVINAAPESQRGIAASLVIVFRLIGMSVGLSALTAWGLYRFNILRTQVELPAITDPNFGAALAAGLSHTTITILAETFLISGLISALTLLIAANLRQEKKG